MNEERIWHELTTIFRDVFDDDGIVLSPGTTANDIAGWDSQAHITLTVAAEQHFGVRFRTSELEQLHDVGDFVRLIARRLAPAA
jgi:acyl carrier protein